METQEMDRGKAGNILYELWCQDIIPDEVQDNDLKYEFAIKYILKHGHFDYDDFCKRLNLLIRNAFENMCECGRSADGTLYGKPMCEGCLHYNT